MAIGKTWNFAPTGYSEKRRWNMDSLEWSRQYPILTISRLELVHQLGFTTEQVASLTDEDMECLAERLQALYFRNIFDEYVRFITSTILLEVRTGGEAHE